MKKYKFYISIFLFMLAFLFINTSINANEIYFDYSRENSLDTKSMSASELIEYIYNIELTDSEIEYLEKYPNVFKYEDKIPLNNIITNLGSNNLSIYADIYSYPNKDGNTISWIPYTARINSNVVYFELDGDRYKAVVNDLPEEGETISITYKTNYLLDKDIFNTLANEAYNLADYYVTNKIIEKEEEKYNNAYKQYELDLANYNQYLIDLDNYDINLELYNQYKKDLRQYELDLAEYNQYLELLEDYNTNLELYNQYQLDLAQYEKDLAAYYEYEKEIEDYENYLEEYETYSKYMSYVNYALSTMDLIKTPMTSQNRTLYDAIMGNSVTQVLARKDELLMFDVPEKAINNADKATKNLREYYTAYFNCQTDKEKYTYYRSNRGKIATNTTLLLRSLDELYAHDVVRSGIATFGDDKDLKFRILLAQLALFSNAVIKGDIDNYNKTGVYNSSYKFGGTTVNTLLEGFTFEDNDELYLARPNYPSVVPVEPVKPEEVLEPVKPTEVLEPVKPTPVVEKPVEPALVLEPVKPTLVLEPTLPTEYEPDPLILSLINDYDNGLLYKKEEFNEDIILEFTTEFTKNYKNPTSVTIEFYDLSNNYINSYTTEYGSYITYTDVIPNKEPDQQYASYKFSHWEYEDGTILNLNNITKAGAVYPVIVPDKLQSYLVSWIVDGNTISEIYEYGSIPSYNGELTKPISGNNYYLFNSWDKEIVEVTEDVEYEAIFDEFDIIISDNDVSYEAKDDSIDIIIDSSDNYNIDIEKLFDFVIDDSTVSINVSANNCQLSLPIDDNIKNIIVNIEENNEFDYSFSVSVFDKDNQLINNEIEITIDGTFNPEKSLLYIEDENGELSVVTNVIISDNKLYLRKLNANTKYHIYPLYQIKVFSSKYINLELDNLFYKYGDLVTINYKLLIDGIKLSSLTIVDELGNNYECSEDYSFTMPNKDIILAPNHEYFNYTVKFIVEGKVVREDIYKYGDDVILLLSPVKPSDENYTYEFIGWDKEIVEVKEDAEYVAVFEAIEIIKESNVKKKKKISKTVILIYAAQTALGLGMTGCFMLIGFLLKKLLRKLIK